MVNLNRGAPSQAFVLLPPYQYPGDSRVDSVRVPTVFPASCKAEQVLLYPFGALGEMGESKVSRWVFSASQKERTFSFCGTIEYMAPEIIRSKAGHGKVGCLGEGGRGEAEHTGPSLRLCPVGRGLVEPGHPALRAADGGLALHTGGREEHPGRGVSVSCTTRGGQLRAIRPAWVGLGGGSLPLTPRPSSQTDLEVLPSLPPPDRACGTGPTTAAAVQGP